MSCSRTRLVRASQQLRAPLWMEVRATGTVWAYPGRLVDEVP